MKFFSKSIIIILLFVFIFNLLGCWDRKDLRIIAISTGLAIDKNDDGRIQITFQVLDLQQGKLSKVRGQEESKALNFWNIIHEGKTIHSAAREAAHTSPHQIFGGHAQVLIISKELAEENIMPYLDFILRDYRLRETMNIFISEGEAGKTLSISTRLDPIPGFHIANLSESAKKTSHAPQITVHEFALRTVTRGMVPVAPIIGIKDGDEDKELYIHETAVFNKNLKMVGRLNKKETRGMLWILGDANQGVLLIKGKDGKTEIATEILRSTSEVNPYYENGKFRLIIKITNECRLTEVLTEQDILDPKIWDILERNQTNVIRNEIQAAIKKAKVLNADIFGFGNTIYKKYPEEWKRIEDNWEDIFPELEVIVQVNTRLLRTEMIHQTIKPR